jgi:hypothetical protein
VANESEIQPETSQVLGLQVRVILGVITVVVVIVAKVAEIFMKVKWQL